jgi:hypothetical protein
MADEVLIGRPVQPELSQESRTPSTVSLGHSCRNVVFALIS